MTARSEPLSATLRWEVEDAVVDGVRQRRFDVLHDDKLVPGLLWTPSLTGSRQATANASPATADATPATADATPATRREGPWPLVLLGHGASGSKREHHVVNLGRRLASTHGLAAAAIDGPVHGDRRSDQGAPSNLVLMEFAQLWANDGEAMTDAMVADWLTTISALQELDEIDDGPVGWWGVSMGTIVGVPVVAAVRQIGAAVLGLMGITCPTSVRIDRDARALRCPILFLVQWDDVMFPRKDALALFGTLGTTDKRLIAHPGGHGELPSEAFEASARFLARRLGGPRRVPGRGTSGSGCTSGSGRTDGSDHSSARTERHRALARRSRHLEPRMPTHDGEPPGVA